MDVNRINEKTYNDIQKSMYSVMIISRLVNTICLIKGQHPSSKTMIINKAVLITTKAVYDDLILRFIYNKKISIKTLRCFIGKAAVYWHTQRGKSYPRISGIPYTKWYVKNIIINIFLNIKYRNQKKLIKNT